MKLFSRPQPVAAHIVKAPHAQSSEAVIAQLHSHPETGLSTVEARQRAGLYGKNELTQHLPRKTWLIFLEQFTDPVILVLGAAMALAFLFEEALDGIAVLLVILISATIGFFMEWQAVRSMEALRKIAQTKSTVCRDGLEKDLISRYLVPGDILILRAGDAVSADARVLHSENLSANESALTGESAPVEKQRTALPLSTLLADRNNMVFKGTIITRGSGRAIVTGIADHTELGRVHHLTQATTKARAPIDKKLRQLTTRLIQLTLFITVLIILLGWLRGNPLIPLLKTGIALAVAAIPEGLPIVVTIALARGMLRLTKKQVVIKKMDAVQTLGEVSIICTDKTGTLTENEMAVHTLLLPDTSMEVREMDDAAMTGAWASSPALRKLTEAGILCSNAGESTHIRPSDPVEMAFLPFAQKVGQSPEHLRRQYPELLESPFDTTTKRMATLHRAPEGYLVYAKGALEHLIPQCTQVLSPNGVPIPFSNQDEWMARAERLAAQGLRILGYAYSLTQDMPAAHALYQELVFVGVAAFLDPPRSDVNQAIASYRKAGIEVVMITGDHPGTARKIAEETGLIAVGAPDEVVLRGQDIPSVFPVSAPQQAILDKARVFARVSPEQKLWLIDYYQRQHQVVGMTGDGVNDAPALKKADIGIAMGIRGTEAAQETADLILEDDKFASIALAIQQGRAIFEKIRQFVVYLLSSNLAEILSVTAATLSNIPVPLLPLQILFLNLVTDVFPALAIGMGEGGKDLMEQPPRPAGHPIMTKAHWRDTLLYGLSISLSILGISLFAWKGLQLPAAVVNNMAFYTLVLAQLLNVLNLPARGESFFQNEITTNRWVWGALALSTAITLGAYLVPASRHALDLLPLQWSQIGWVILFGLGSLLIAQILKSVFQNQA